MFSKNYFSVFLNLGISREMPIPVQVASLQVAFKFLYWLFELQLFK